MTVQEDKKEDKTPITWIRPSGNEITTNSNTATIAHAKANGWKKKQAYTVKTL